MPSNLPTDNSPELKSTGTLYVVATPIGNMEDITLRALNILRDVDLIAAEDTRMTGKLLAHYRIQSHFISYHEHNERERTPGLIQKLKAGKSIALVSNAGTPCVSDPGYRLIEAAIQHKINVTPIPGVSAATAALSVAGLPTDSFVFIGFPPKKKGRRLTLLSELAREPRTVIFYESPKRMIRLLEEAIQTVGDRQGVLAREITKRYEEFLRGHLSEIRKMLIKYPEVKGECTLLIAGSGENETVSWEAVRNDIRTALKSEAGKLSDIAKNLAKQYRLPKSKIYEEIMKIRDLMAKKSGLRNQD